MKVKRLIKFARVEPTKAAIREGVNNFGSEWNKKIVFYVTDGKKIFKIGEENYNPIKEKIYKGKIIFIDEKIKDKIFNIRQDLGAITIKRYP